jgi:hypothetical protein
MQNIWHRNKSVFLLKVCSLAFVFHSDGLDAKLVRSWWIFRCGIESYKGHVTFVDVGEDADLLYQAATFCGVCCVKAASRGGCGVAMENSRLFTSFLMPQVLNAPGLFWFSSNLTFPDPLCKSCKLTWQPSFIVHAVHAATPRQGCPCRPSRMWRGILLVSD